jgi:hypothetical protein
VNHTSPLTKCMLKVGCKLYLSIHTCMLDNQGGWSISPGRVKNFHFSILSRLALGPTQPPIKWVLGVLSPGIKQQGRKANHSLPTSVEVNTMWVYTSTPLLIVNRIFVFLSIAFVSSSTKLSAYTRSLCVPDY